MFYAWADICSLYSFGVIPTCLRNSLWKLLLSATPTKVCTDDVEASSSLSRRLASSTRRSSRQVRKVVCMRLVKYHLSIACVVPSYAAISSTVWSLRTNSFSSTHLLMASASRSSSSESIIVSDVSTSYSTSASFSLAATTFTMYPAQMR